MNSRSQAAAILTAVLRDGRSLTAALADTFANIADHSERAFVQALSYGVVRHYFRLDGLLSQLLPTPLKAKDSDIKALLLMGLYQLDHMRVKPHAAVSETVAATGHKPWARSLVNAVLRRYQREGAAVQAASLHDKQVQLNHPNWLIERLEQDWPTHTQAILHANDAQAPMFLRVNRLKISRDDYLALLLASGMTARPVTLCDTAIELDAALPVERLPGFDEGLVSVQDAAAQLAAPLLELAPGQQVLDLCAAPGGKTAAMLEREPGLASLLALDIDDQRLQRVRTTLDRLGLHAELLGADACLPENWANGRRFDRILLDAPCSGLGVIRRHPDIKLLRRADDIENLVALQGRILDAVWSLLVPGGLLLYATCSIAKAENEQQIAAFLGRTPDATEHAIDDDWGQPRPHGRQILTGDHGMDGFFYARLRKTA
ncbi:MAG: 16S rRNA (cytosine(967)-C(5))-methyltransferase RsmB [Methylomonas sp.]|nr:16S rRNA (cytosine(967)-C(5))-methyltransferase RsmB [Methylomonas sp.]PPD20062.1 MAG: 16S rRNA (cytosine(967)-C(5))-methyltransferase [Methylomonas sp.]PPD25997.1 MAG: 16S rRNA (cytosine(967)-C(5))-methyltransferase [Methylomonas sp.]PPD37726.1 MAG: 16S rRNA (cytosine(967)-C(5))-methyltransferase [Methylomonas sp.]PPD39594.1 MAG: 16S rRNA (cytosine(967)-C(5))-methyltransferase [Methylomonas sp.]